VRVIRKDSEDELSLGVVGFDFVKLVQVIESHHFDSFLLSVLDVLGEFARVGKDEFGGVIIDQVLDEGHLSLGSTVEASAKSCQSSQNGWVRVAFDGCRRKKPNVSYAL